MFHKNCAYDKWNNNFYVYTVIHLTNYVFFLLTPEASRVIQGTNHIFFNFGANLIQKDDPRYY